MIGHEMMPSVDVGRNNVYLPFWKDSTDEAYLACINRGTGALRYSRAFSNIPTADRAIHSVAIGSDGTLYFGCRTKLYALEPGASSFNERWIKDKLLSRYMPVAVGPDDALYAVYWTEASGSYYVTLAKLRPSDGGVRWEVSQPDVGTYTNYGQPYVTGNGIILFPVTWDTQPTETFEILAYQDNAAVRAWPGDIRVSITMKLTAR